MKIQALGVYGGLLPGKRTTSFLLNGHTLLDAGGVVEALGIAEQNAVRHILLSHAHLDHVKDIPMLADNVIGLKSDPVEVCAAPEVITTLRNHVFNFQLWPDFTVIPTKESPVIRYREEGPGRVFSVGEFKVEFVRVNHPVPCYASFVSEGDKTLLYTGDTGPTDEVWEVARKKYKKTLKAVITEVSFPDRMAELSLLSGHYSPCHLSAEIDKLGLDVPVLLYHIKPSFEGEVLAELIALGDRRLRPLVQGETIEI